MCFAKQNSTTAFCVDYIETYEVPENNYMSIDNLMAAGEALPDAVLTAGVQTSSCLFTLVFGEKAHYYKLEDFKGENE